MRSPRAPAASVRVAQVRRPRDAIAVWALVAVAAVAAVATPSAAHVATPTGGGATLRSGSVVTTGTPVGGLSSASRLAVTDDHVFIASGQFGSTVAVMNHDGTQAGTLTGISGPVALDVSATELFVAAWGDSSIRVYTLADSPPTPVATLSTLPVQDPTSLVLASGRLWFTGADDALGPHGAIGSMRTDGTGASAYYPPRFEYWQYFGTCGEIDHSAFAPARLFVHGRGCDSPDVVYEYSSASTPPVRLAEYGLSNWGAYHSWPVAVMPDGAGMIVKRGNVFGVADIDTLVPTSEWYAVPGGAAWGQVVTAPPRGSAPAGRIAGQGLVDGELSVHVWEVGDPRPTNTFTFPASEGYVTERGLAFSPSGDLLFVVTRSESTVYFHAVEPTVLGSSLSTRVSATTVGYGRSVTLSGTLTGPPAGATIRFQGDAGAGPVLLGTCTTGSAGTCSIQFEPRARTEVTAVFEGDDPYAGAQSRGVTIQVRVVIDARMRRFSDIQGAYRVYSAREKVSYLAHVRPPHPGRRVYVQFHYDLGSGWRDGGTDPFRQNDGGYVAVSFARGSLPVGRYRLRSVQHADADHLGGRSDWDYFKVVAARRLAAGQPT